MEPRCYKPLQSEHQSIFALKIIPSLSGKRDTIQVNPFAASKANKAARETFFERKDAEREQGKSLGAKAASARGASEKLDGQSQAAPAKDNLEH